MGPWVRNSCNIFLSQGQAGVGSDDVSVGPFRRVARSKQREEEEGTETAVCASGGERPGGSWAGASWAAQVQKVASSKPAFHCQ